MMSSKAGSCEILTQTAITQSTNSTSALPVQISQFLPLPTLPPTKHHVLVRVLAVALNPIDCKMPSHFAAPGSTLGCDFCGVVEVGPGLSTIDGSPHGIQVGDRVCGYVFAYNPSERINGAFAEWLVADVRLLLRVPPLWSDLDAAALGGIGWGVLGLALWSSGGLELEGRPTAAAQGNEKMPVLVYGAGTATGTMACQLLRLSGYSPIAIASAASAPLAYRYGASATAEYTSKACADTVRKIAAPMSLRHALDCITDSNSAEICMAALSRAGGRYTCLEAFEPAWRTRQAVRVTSVMAYESLGVDVKLEGKSSESYSCVASTSKLCEAVGWTGEMQQLLDAGLVRPHPIREVPGRWSGIIEGLHQLHRGEVHGEKLVVRIA
ncbi:hypothetical protein GQ53DRAFT_889194 [Thozetella sp. PMI_491]|nr:hypothetical protein GQ53DRAFT_889194 [Thozetella sp. PMI_491]